MADQGQEKVVEPLAPNAGMNEVDAAAVPAALAAPVAPEGLKVQVVVPGKPTQVIHVPSGTTVERAISMAGVADRGGYRFNNKEVDGSTPVNADGIITVLQQIRGGR